MTGSLNRHLIDRRLCRSHAFVSSVRPTHLVCKHCGVMVRVDDLPTKPEK